MKKIKYFLKKNFKKILVLLSVFVIAFSCFIVSASATTVLNISYTQPKADEKSGYIEIFLNDSSGNLKAVSTWFFTVVGNIDYVESYEPFIEITIPSTNKVNAKVSRVPNSDFDIPITVGYGYCSSYSSASAIAYASFLGNSYDIDCWFSAGYTVAQVRCYGICVRGAGAPNSFFSGYTDASVLYGKDVLINDKMDILINHLTDYQSEITESIQQGNQQVIENANQNTDKILNSGEYTLDMGDSTARLESVENSLFESANLKQLGSSIFDSATWFIDLSPAIMCAGIILDELLNFGGIQYTWFMSIVRFGLAIGIFSLFVAIGPNIAKGISSNKVSGRTKGINNNDKGGKK